MSENEKAYSLSFIWGLEFLMYAENLENTSSPAVLDSGLRAASRGYLWWMSGRKRERRLNVTDGWMDTVWSDGRMRYFGGLRVSSRNSSILLVSVFTSLPYSRNGGWAPGAKSFRISGFLQNTEDWNVDSVSQNHVCTCSAYKQHKPLHVNGGDIERHSFEPQNHEEPLRERTVPDTLTITPSLHTNKRLFTQYCKTQTKVSFHSLTPACSARKQQVTRTRLYGSKPCKQKQLSCIQVKIYLIKKLIQSTKTK